MRKLLMLAAAIAPVACRDSTGPHADITGVYQLTMVNDSALPYVQINAVTDRTVILSGTATLTAIDSLSGTITMTMTYQTTYTTGVTQTLSERDSYGITFTGPNTFTYIIGCFEGGVCDRGAGTVTGSTLTATGPEGARHTYTR